MALGQVIYTHYVFLFQGAGLILLVAMMGAIVLTLRERNASRHQDIARQQGRAVAATLEMMRVPIGAGVPRSAVLRPLPEPTAASLLPAGGDPDPHAPDHHQREH